MKIFKPFLRFNYLLQFILILFILPSVISAQWEEKSNGLPTEQVAFALDAIDSMTAVVLYPRGGSTHYEAVYLTVDGGKNWELIPITLDAFQTISDVSMIDADNIWATTGDGRILKINNRSSDVEIQFSDTTLTKFINYIEMFDMNNGIAMGDDPDYELQGGTAAILKTTDGGKNWVSMNNSAFGGVSGDGWRRIDFINPNTGFFYPSGNSNYSVFKTSDGGSSWEEIAFTKFTMILKFYDENYGLIFGPTSPDSVKEMYRTINGGNTWESTPMANTSWGEDIEFVPGHPEKVWFADYDNLYFSGDSGKSWSVIDVADEKLGGRDIVFTDENVGWLACDMGKVYRTINGGLGVSSVQNSASVPEALQLMQNYPNPFNPETTIKYQLPVSDFVTLKIYDVLGKEVASLAEGFKQSGEHTISFDASKLSSGIYYYSLISGSTRLTKKMLLLK